MWRNITEDPNFVVEERERLGLLEDLPEDLEAELLPYYEQGVEEELFTTGLRRRAGRAGRLRLLRRGRPARGRPGRRCRSRTSGRSSPRQDGARGAGVADRVTRHPTTALRPTRCPAPTHGSCASLSILFVLGLWEWAGRVPVSIAFPTFTDTLAAFMDMLADGTFATPTPRPSDRSWWASG